MTIRDKDKDKDKKDDCRPKQNSCTKSGVGPTCSQATNLSNTGGLAATTMDGAALKKECLEDVKIKCDEALKKCFKEADKNFEREITKDKHDECETFPIKGKNKKRPKKKKKKKVIDPVTGKETDKDEDDDKKCGDDNYTFGIVDYSHTGGSNAHAIADDMFPFKSPGNYIVAEGYAYPLMRHARAYADCYHNIMSECITVHCYCGLYKCGSSDNDAGGFGGPGDDPPPAGEDATPYATEYEKDDINTASLTTTSSIGSPIELFFGTVFLNGNIIWVDDAVSTVSPYTLTTRDRESRTVHVLTKYSVINTIEIHLALGASEAVYLESLQIGGGEVILDDAAYALKRGTESQKVDKAAARKLGFGNVPAYRGLSYIACRGVPINKEATEVPAITAKVVSSSEIAFHLQETTDSDYSSGGLFKVNDAAKRLYSVRNDGATVRCSNLEDMSAVWEESVTGVPQDITESARIISRDGLVVTVKEPLTSIELLDVSVPSNVSDVFYSKFYDSTLSGTESIAHTTTTGLLTFQGIDETTPEVLSSSTASAAFGSAIQRIVSVKTQRSYATIGIGVTRGVYDTITLSQVEHHAQNTDSSLLLETGYVTTFTLPTSLFKNVTTLVVRAVAQSSDGKILIGCSSPVETTFILWDAFLKQVAWVSYTTVPCPLSPLKVFTDANVIGDNYYFLAGDDLYVLSLQTGQVSLRRSAVITNFSASAQQYYSQNLKSVVSTREGAQIKVSTGVVTPNVVYVISIISAILEKSGLDLSQYTLPNFEKSVIGYRTGNATTAKTILEDLLKIYGVKTVELDKISFTDFSDFTSAATVDASTVQLGAAKTFSGESTLNIRAALSYLSAENGEELVISSHSFEDTSFNFAEETYATTAYLYPDNARIIVENLSFLQSYNNYQAEFIVGTQQLGLSPGDNVEYAGKVFVVVRSTINEFFTQSLTLKASDVGRSDSLPAMQENFVSQRFEQEARESTIASPVSVFSKSIPGVHPGANSSSYYGALNLDRAFDSIARIATNTVEIDNITTIAGQTLRATKPLAWGRLKSLSVETGTTQFNTKVSQTLRVLCPSQDVVNSILSQDNYYGAYPDRRTVDPYYNVVVVGNELIQYGYARADGLEVTCYDLIRNGRNTDGVSDNHFVDEFCAFLVDKSYAAQYISTDEQPFSTDLVTISDIPSVNRKIHAKTSESLYLPCAPGYVVRTDEQVFTSFLFTAPLVVNRMTFGIRLRSEVTPSFGDSRTSISGGLSPVSNSTYSFYLVQGEWDFDAFVQQRFEPRPSSFVDLTDWYIIAANHKLDMKLVGTSATMNITISDVAYTQDFYTRVVTKIVRWDATKPLHVVLAHKNDFGEVFSVFAYPANHFFTDAPSRGVFI